ncbi:MAG TPA: 50S ribosomal protein L23 [Candidatus Omnitrophota bacterium]|nr:50S ribosomal protein L23 [Candidatus Omnitrophota bacterium]
MRLNVYDIVMEPLITEKLSQATEKANQYGFRVHPQANKKEIKSAVEKIFNVHVEKVNTMNVSGKWRRVRYVPGQTAAWKKAVITLRKGEKIDLTK